MDRKAILVEQLPRPVHWKLLLAITFTFLIRLGLAGAKHELAMLWMFSDILFFLLVDLLQFGLKILQPLLLGCRKRRVRG